MTNVLQVDVYSDFVCPWCFIGTTRLERAIDRVLGDGREFARTRAEALSATQSGVRGVPLVIFNGHERVSGAQAPDVFRRAIATALAASAASRGAMAVAQRDDGRSIDVVD